MLLAVQQSLQTRRTPSEPKIYSRSFTSTGTGGLRKIRFAPPSWRRGKSGGIRVGYAFFEEYSTVALIVAYAKKGKADVTPAERAVIKQLIALMSQFLDGGAREEVE
jgi:hypothetical protein